MSSLGPLEAETCRDYVVPRLREAGWSDDQIVEQYRITDGRVIPTRGRHRRGDPLKADYVLEIAPGFPVAVVEAKREYKKPADGLGQAIRYAMPLDLPLAYSTNGLGIVERDFDTGLEDDTLASFPSPSEAWLRYRRWKGFGVDAETTLELADDDVHDRRGYLITTPLRTVLDVAAGALEIDEVGKAIADGERQGRFTRRMLLQRADELGPAAALRIERALRWLEDIEADS